MTALTEEQRGILATIREWVNKDVIPVAQEMDVAGEYPHELVEKMKEFGLFGATIPQEYGGLGLDFKTYAMIIEEICRGWMSPSGIINSHLIVAYMINARGTPEQKEKWLPKMATGEWRLAMSITEPDAGSDVANIQTRAIKQGDHYVLNGQKTWCTNSYYGTHIMVFAKTDPTAGHKGISGFFCPKSDGLNIMRKLPKLGYRGVDTAEFSLDDYKVPAENLVGLEEGKGFYMVMDGLEVGRINVAARAVGVARAAFEAAHKYSQKRHTMGKPIAQHQAIQALLADMATNIQAAHLLVVNAAEKKDSGKRCDLEAGMAKLFASEICEKASLDSMRVHGSYGFSQELPVERYYRDAPLMIIGEGTSEIQRIVIARALVKEHPEGDFIYQQMQ
jgi:alkylation response protein AidB-like acyl-CoA dehydrogenase